MLAFSSNHVPESVDKIHHPNTHDINDPLSPTSTLEDNILGGFWASPIMSSIASGESVVMKEQAQIISQ